MACAVPVEACLADAVLMHRVALTGDEQAFELLYGRYQRRIHQFFYGLTRHAGAAEDLCQETFCRVWTLRTRYRPTGVFAAYLFAVARLIWLEACRGVAKDRRLGNYALDEDQAYALADTGRNRPDQLADCADLERRIFEALDTLPDDQRTVFLMRVVEGVPLEEIATALACPVNTVRSRKLLAIKKLQTALAAYALQ